MNSACVHFRDILSIVLKSIDLQKIYFARQQGGDRPFLGHPRPITQRNYFSEGLYESGENPNNYQKEANKLHSFTELKIQTQLKNVRDQKKALIRMLGIFFCYGNQKAL
ncbi:MAG: hypothetical protein WA151_05745 [Desulfatirhabdiaceae bacterium]